MSDEFGDGFEWSVGGEKEDFVGIEWLFGEDGTRLNQHKYIDNELKEVDLSATRFKPRHDSLSYTHLTLPPKMMM